MSLFLSSSSSLARRGFFLGLLLVAVISSVTRAQCADVHVVFARGTGESPGLGMCGSPLVSGLKNNLRGRSVSSHAVDYLADVAQLSAGPGATDMTNHLTQVALRCPQTDFVIGGYSQGASVTDIAIGIRTLLGVGKVIPDSLATRIKAVVTFGNPLMLSGQTIASASKLYGRKAVEMCKRGDPICGAGLNIIAHLSYPLDGSVARAALQAARLVGGESAIQDGDETESPEAPGVDGNATTVQDSPVNPATRHLRGDN